MSGYVALGSSMAAGPRIRPSADGAPFAAGRSARNYPHLVAEKLVLNLVDVTYSGATTANVLPDSQNGAPRQMESLDGSEDLVTVTIGGNDAGHVPLLSAAAVPRIVRHLPLIGRRARSRVVGSSCSRNRCSPAWSGSIRSMWGERGSLLYFAAVVAVMFAAAIMVVNRRDA